MSLEGEPYDRAPIIEESGDVVGWFGAELCWNLDELEAAVRKTVLFCEYCEFLKGFDMNSHLPASVLHWIEIEAKKRRTGQGTKALRLYLTNAKRRGAKLALLKAAYDSGEDWKEERRWKWHFYESVGFIGFTDDDDRSPLMYRLL